MFASWSATYWARAVENSHLDVWTRRSDGPLVRGLSCLLTGHGIGQVRRRLSNDGICERRDDVAAWRGSFLERLCAVR